MKRWLFFFVVLFSISACSSRIVEQPPVETDPVVTVETTSTLTPTPTQEPLQSITICTSKLPESLFPYDGIQTSSKSNLLKLIYEEGFLERNAEMVPGIVDKVPSQTDGDLQLEPVSVQGGQAVVDEEGALVVLKEGVRVRPSGCRETSCAIAWNGQNPLEMDRMVVELQLKEGITWSDGTPLTAADSQFGFQVSSHPDTPGLKWIEDRTEAYHALDDQTLQWVGKPGFTTAQIGQLFWKPLPSHVFSLSEGWAGLLDQARAQMASPGYGPFVVGGFDEGVLRLVANPHYYGRQEGMPGLDEVIIRNVEGGAQAAWSVLQAGECDVIDTSFELAGAHAVLEEVRVTEGFDLVVENGESWTQLVFGIKPASYDDFYNPQLGDRPDLLGDVRTRQAIMHCLDREAMLESTFGDLTHVWPSFLPLEKSRLEQGETTLFDLQTGRDLLQEVGWVDHDANSETPLLAYYVAGVPANTPFTLELLVSSSGFHQELVQIVQGQWKACGVGVTVTSLPEEELYAPGPEGPLFGRQFDLALISWQPLPSLDCALYQSSAIPGGANQWIGTNIAGLSDEAYDQACQNAVLTLADDFDEGVRAAEEAYLDLLPAIPLFAVPEVIVLPSAECFGVEIETVRDFFSQLPSLDRMENCP